jgi:predicted TIM-barrel fold metal-dependent hydrolase
MIIDADTHISSLQEGNRISYDELLRRMDRSGVERALSWLQPTYFRDMQAGNRYVAEAMKKHPDRILGFGWVDPHYGLEQCRVEIKRCIEEYGFYGVKLNGAQNEFLIDDKETSLPLIKAIVTSGKLLAFHIGADSFENTHPFRLAKIAMQFPEAKILSVHMGGAAVPDLSRAMLEFAQVHKNVYLIGSAVNPQAVLRAINILGPQRVLFGSDTPFGLMHVEVAKFKALLEDVDETARNLILSGNIVRLFGL